MGETGILPPDARVELIEGEIIDMPPIASRHAGTVERIAAVLRDAISPKAMVRTQQPIALDKHSEPQPDIAVVRRRSDYYESHHPVPADVLLIVEVADATLRYDKRVKAPLYAKHLIPEIWIVDVERRRLTRYRDPHAGVFGVVDTPSPDSAIGLSAAPGVEVRLISLFGA
jgi:Uma2 family endonuclease